MAEHFIGPVMEKLIDACFEYLKDQVRWQTGMVEELKKLRVIHPQIKAVVSAYSQVEIEDPSLSNWLWQLRDAVDEADNVLDEFEYRKREEEASKNKKLRRVRSLMKSLKKRFVKIGKRALKIDPSLKRLEEAVHKLYEISAGVSTFLHLLDRANQEQQKLQLELHRKRETGSMPTNDLLGRSKEMEFVTQWLRNPYQTEITNSTDLYRNISLLSVVGHGGMGKTALLQHVYKDETTEEFDVKMWVCVSNNFDSKTVITNILETLKKEKPRLESLEALQSSLQSEVKSKRFLLVLDDIWEGDEMKWKNVLAPLQYGSSGSKILITTRLDSVASEISKMIKKNKEMMSLKGLEEDDCLKLFNTHAFAGVQNPDDKFRSIAKKIVEKLSGCPLAIKVIGGMLNDCMDEHYWKKVLNTDIGNVSSNQNHDLMPILKLSYIYLPKFLQNCFTFCCIFPQDHQFDKNDLARMWIALGFIQPSNIQGETIEEIGRRYFDILVRKSFFDEFHAYKRVYYMMHDLLHELAQSVSTQQCFRIVDNKKLSIPPHTIRHLSIKNHSRRLKVTFQKGNFQNLRSLFLSFSDYTEFDESIIHEIFMASKNIRLLVITAGSLKEAPETIGCLIHLRYLKFQNFWRLELPRCISHLYHLQFIVFKSLLDLQVHKDGWSELKPNEHCQLILKELFLRDPSATWLTMEPLRSISSFRYLEITENDELVSFETETEQWLLQYSSSLFELRINELQSLQSLPSCLESLSSLQILTVYDVPQLKLLPNPPASLTTLHLYNLESLQCLPSSLSAISSLEVLKLKNIPLLKSLPDLPSSLRRLILKELQNLDCLPSTLPTTLYRLWIIKVPLLVELPDLPSSLKELSLRKLESLQCLPSSLSAISSLETLSLKNIPLLRSLPDFPSSLRDLQLKEFENLDCMPSCLPALRRLRIINVPQLLELPDLPASLKALYIQDCHPQLMDRYENFDRR